MSEYSDVRSVTDVATLVVQWVETHSGQHLVKGLIRNGATLLII
jgi:hypothetical protein